jgi:hypothetical protein
MASTRDEEEVHTYEGLGVMAPTRAEEEVLRDEGFAMGASQSYGGMHGLTKD